MTRGLMMRTFQLTRDVDVSGVSGTGVVADGCQFPDGTVAMRWRGDRASTAIYSDVAVVEAIHGHGGATRIVWASSEGPSDRVVTIDIPDGS